MQMLGDGEEDESKECWTTVHTLRGHIEDVSDLSWSADGSRLASSGIDHSVIIWDAKEVRLHVYQPKIISRTIPPF